MWFGLTLIPAGETPQAADGDVVLVAIYRPDGARIMRVGAPVTALADTIRLIRGASHGAPRGRPRCGHCGSDFGIPDLDGSGLEERCPSI